LVILGNQAEFYFQLTNEASRSEVRQDQRRPALDDIVGILKIEMFYT
jgi:hypothetical protein